MHINNNGRRVFSESHHLAFCNTKRAIKDRFLTYVAHLRAINISHSKIGIAKFDPSSFVDRPNIFDSTSKMGCK